MPAAAAPTLAGENMASYTPFRHIHYWEPDWVLTTNPWSGPRPGPGDPVRTPMTPALADLPDHPAAPLYTPTPPP